MGRWTVDLLQCLRWRREDGTAGFEAEAAALEQQGPGDFPQFIGVGAQAVEIEFHAADPVAPECGLSLGWGGARGVGNWLLGEHEVAHGSERGDQPTDVSEVNLNAETQKLRVKVYPSVSDSVAVAGALLGGPVAGIASFLVQKVLRDPFDKMTAYEYDITGTWSDPQVSKAGTAPAGGSKEPAAER